METKKSAAKVVVSSLYTIAHVHVLNDMHALKTAIARDVVTGSVGQ